MALISTRRRLALLALAAGALAACSDNDSDQMDANEIEAGGAVSPALVVPDPGLEPNIPPGGLAGERGSAGDNTPTVSLDSSRRVLRDSAARDVPPPSTNP